MTLEMPEIDSKGQSAHLCFYLLNAFYFPVPLFSRCMLATADLCFTKPIAVKLTIDITLDKLSVIIYGR